ncbi:hypothetical protein V5799_007991, partial [Amblyomma americanum]
MKCCSWKVQPARSGLYYSDPAPLEKMSRYFTVQADASKKGTNPPTNADETTKKVPSKNRKKLTQEIEGHQAKKLETEAFPSALKKAAAKYDRSGRIRLRGVKTKVQRKKIQARAQKVRQSVLQAARAELLLPEDVGYLQADEGEETFQLRQPDIANAVDITSCTK